MIKKVMLIGLIATSLAGQDGADEQRRAQQAREEALRAQQERAAAEADRKQRELSIERMKEFQRDVAADIHREADRSERIREAQRKQRAADLQKSLVDFVAANEDFREAAGLHKPLKDVAKRLEKNTGLFLDYIRQVNDLRGKLNTSQFKGIEQDDLMREALATSERLEPQLMAIAQSEVDTTIDIKMLQSLSGVENDLLRLQWMSRRLK